MKKLMFATALVASAAAFADGPLNATSFEGYNSVDGSFLSDKGDVGEGGGAKYFYYDGDSDGSLVKAFGGDNLAVPGITRPLYYATATPNAKYLELNTEGGILWRSINTIGGDANAYTLGRAQSVAADGTYLDTLVQFTATEDGNAPTTESDDKLAIWLNVDSSTTPATTNLMVKAKYYFFNGGPDATATNFVLVAAEGTKSIVAGSWYRLTIKAIPNVLDGEGAAGVIPGFEIYVDGVQMCATEPQFESGDGGFAEMASNMATATTAAAIGANKLFPSLAQMGNLGDPVTLQGVGFKGSGAIDDLVWTEEDPFANAGGDDYKVVIDGNDVVVTPTQADLETIGQALPGLNVNDPTAVNAALATPIEGSGGIPAWQALFLGLAPTTNDLETIKIDSIKLENGKILIEMAEGLTLKTGRGVSILFKVFASNDLTTWGESPIVTATDTTEIPEITPALGETKKFYKVVVEFAASSAQN